MATYQLRFSDDGIGCAKRVEFDAPDASAALIVAHQESPNRNVELWKDGARLCTIRRTANEVWELNPVAAPDNAYHQAA